MVDLKEFRKVNDLTQAQLAKIMGVSRSFVGQIECGLSKFPKEYLDKLVEYGQYDTSMLVTTTDNEEESMKKETRVIQELDHYLVPVLPVSACGGSLSDYNRGVMRSECEQAVSPIAGADMIIPVTGESMAPEYPNGSRVVVKQINDKAFIEWGRTYVLSTVNGIVIKELRKSGNDDELECVSLNPDPRYASFRVKRADVLGIYRVLMCMAMK